VSYRCPIRKANALYKNIFIEELKGAE